MARNRARESARRGAALLGAALLVIVLAPVSASAGTPAKGPAIERRPSDARTVGRVDAMAASRLGPRVVPAAVQLPARAHPKLSVARPTTAKPHTVTPAITPPPPALTVARTVFTQSQNDVLLEPPDPWVVANGSYVLASSNGMVRVLNRTGSTLANIPTFALFATDTLHFESDPRILWDAAHGRWVGVVLTFDAAGLDCSLTLAVSDSANPLGTWTIHRLNYGSELPDYPGIASTSDKVILTSNLYFGETYDGTAWQAVDWASLIAGGTTASDMVVITTGWNARPIRNVGTPSATGYIVWEDPLDTNHILMSAITGKASVAAQGPAKDLGITAGPDSFSRGPRQPGGTIEDLVEHLTPVDSRIPDAVMSGDTVFFARSMMADQGGAEADFIVEAYTASLASVLAGAATTTRRVVGAADVDYWMPGVGISTGDAMAGTGFFLSYMRSSSAESPSAWAAGGLDGYTFGEARLIAASAAPYTSVYQRWGDFMGITPDPGGTMAVWAATEISAADGGWQEVVARLLMDDSPPLAAPGTPAQSLLAGTQLGVNTVPVKISYTGTTDQQSGIRSYLVFEYAYGGSVVVPGTSFVESVAAFAYGDAESLADRFQVVALNEAGIYSPTSSWGASLTPTIFQQTRATYRGRWSNASGSAYSGHSTKYATSAGASATFKVSGRSFAWVSYRASTRGKARVYVDGVLKSTISLKSSVTRARSIPYAITFSKSGTHTIKVVVVSGRVDVDAFVVLR
ncbi:MAG: hypothetical protein U0838_14205 [Chloroflexota bacterium]